MTLMPFIAGVLGGLFVIVVIAAVGGLRITKTGSDSHPACTQEWCPAWRLPSCGSGHCAFHCDLHCWRFGDDTPSCIDPRPAAVGVPGHRPTVIKGGKS